MCQKLIFFFVSVSPTCSEHIYEEIPERTKAANEDRPLPPIPETSTNPEDQNTKVWIFFTLSSNFEGSLNCDWLNKNGSIWIFKFNFLLQKEFRSLWFFSKNIESWKKTFVLLTFFFWNYVFESAFIYQKWAQFYFALHPSISYKFKFPCPLWNTINECH